jgi:hypothetical protein
MDNNFMALKSIDLCKNRNFNQIESVFTKIKPIAEEFKNKKDIKPPYNIILAASDIYYYENYHSDIMAYILKNKPETIKYFIEYVNGIPAPKDMLRIDEKNYLNIEVKREENKIDILIKDLTSRHCIIVENKINNAGDMPRQLPKYYRTIKDEYKVDKVDRILYYSFDGTKTPNKSTWKPEDLKLGLENIIVYGAASNETKTDYINAFLIKCKDNAKNEEEKSFYGQYIALLEYLRRKNHMEIQLMGKFYKEMLDVEQYSSALCIREMLNEFIEFRRNQIRSHFKNAHSPFEKPYDAFNNGMVYEYIREISEERIKLDIYSEENKTKILFWIQDSEIEFDLIKKILEKIGEFGNFKKQEINNYEREFEFPGQEKEMYEYIERFFSLLDENKDKIKL